jgi:hypothetical protein
LRTNFPQSHTRLAGDIIAQSKFNVNNRKLALLVMNRKTRQVLDSFPFQSRFSSRPLRLHSTAHLIAGPGKLGSVTDERNPMSPRAQAKGLALLKWEVLRCALNDTFRVIFVPNRGSPSTLLVGAFGRTVVELYRLYPNWI